MSYADVARRLTGSLHLEHRIMVTGLADTPPARLPRYDGPPLKACQMLDVVRFEGKAFHTVMEDHLECKNAIRWFGFSGGYEGHLNGEWGAGDYPDQGRSLFRCPAFFRRMASEAPLIQADSTRCVYFTPLDKADEAPLRGDETALIIADPRQLQFIAQAAVYSSGGLCRGITGPGTCMSIIAGPFLHRVPYYTLGCFGARQFMKVKGRELFFGIPVDMLSRLADDLECLLARRPDLKPLLDAPADARPAFPDQGAAVLQPAATSL